MKIGLLIKEQWVQVQKSEWPVLVWDFLSSLWLHAGEWEALALLIFASVCSASGSLCARSRVKTAGSDLLFPAFFCSDR